MSEVMMRTVFGEVGRHHFDFLSDTATHVKKSAVKSSFCPVVDNDSVSETYSRCSLILPAIQQQKTNVSCTPVEVRNSSV